MTVTTQPTSPTPGSMTTGHGYALAAIARLLDTTYLEPTMTVLMTVAGRALVVEATLGLWLSHRSGTGYSPAEVDAALVDPGPTGLGALLDDAIADEEHRLRAPGHDLDQEAG